MPDDTILCWKDKTRVGDYKNWKAVADQQKLSELIVNRLTERYIDPVFATPSPNGFASMGVSCLLIETLEAFYQGWPSSEKRSQLAFCLFFDREHRFRDFRGHAAGFYKHVRCGILHQGETTGGWVIRRRGALFDPWPAKLAVNAARFHTILRDCIVDYGTELSGAAWSEEIWKHFFVKMDATVRNCERVP